MLYKGPEVTLAGVGRDCDFDSRPRRERKERLMGGIIYSIVHAAAAEEKRMLCFDTIPDIDARTGNDEQRPKGKRT